MSTIIELQDVIKHYDDGNIRALDGVSLAVEDGDFVALVGPSGSGKSTLLNMIGALDVPDEGRVIIDGRDLAREKDLASFRGRTIGFVFQMHNLIPSLSALDNVQVPLIVRRMSRGERRRKAKKLLELVGLSDRMDNLVTTLSGGERQRVAIARALVNEPRILLADEPTGSVDTVNSGKIIELLKGISAERGMTLVVITHDPSVAAKARKRVRIVDGRVVSEEQQEEEFIEAGEQGEKIPRRATG
ncbi:MAG: ABC transporter ATP-binding protein [Candidatus Geothermincolia bacterium]